MSETLHGSHSLAAFKFKYFIKVSRYLWSVVLQIYSPILPISDNKSQYLATLRSLSWPQFYQPPLDILMEYSLTSEWFLTLLPAHLSSRNNSSLCVRFWAISRQLRAGWHSRRLPPPPPPWARGRARCARSARRAPAPEAQCPPAPPCTRPRADTGQPRWVTEEEQESSLTYWSLCWRVMLAARMSGKHSTGVLLL